MFGISRDLGQPAPLAKLLGRHLSPGVVPQQGPEISAGPRGWQLRRRTAVTAAAARSPAKTEQSSSLSSEGFVNELPPLP